MSGEECLLAEESGLGVSRTGSPEGNTARGSWGVPSANRNAMFGLGAFQNGKLRGVAAGGTKQQWLEMAVFNFSKDIPTLPGH